MPEDNPTIGMILCKSKDRTTVEFALRNIQSPIGVASFQIRNDLPESLQGSLPTVEQLELALEEIEPKSLKIQSKSCQDEEDKTEIADL